MEMILEKTGTKTTPAAKFNGRKARAWVWRFNCLATCWRARRRWRKRLAATRIRTKQTWAKLYRKPKKLLETSTTSMNLFLWPVISLSLAPTLTFPNSGTISLVCGGQYIMLVCFSRFLTQSCQSSSLQPAPTCCSACHPPRWPKMPTLHHLWHFRLVHDNEQPYPPKKGSWSRANFGVVLTDDAIATRLESNLARRPSVTRRTASWSVSMFHRPLPPVFRGKAMLIFQ